MPNGGVNNNFNTALCFIFVLFNVKASRYAINIDIIVDILVTINELDNASLKAKDETNDPKSDHSTLINISSSG